MRIVQSCMDRSTYPRYYFVSRINISYCYYFPEYRSLWVRWQLFRQKFAHKVFYDLLSQSFISNFDLGSRTNLSQFLKITIKSTYLFKFIILVCNLILFSIHQLTCFNWDLFLTVKSTFNGLFMGLFVLVFNPTFSISSLNLWTISFNCFSSVDSSNKRIFCTYCNRKLIIKETMPTRRPTPNEKIILYWVKSKYNACFSTIMNASY